MGLPGRVGNESSASSAMIRGGPARSSDTIIVRNLPLDCNWQVRNSNQFLFSLDISGAKVAG